MRLGEEASPAAVALVRACRDEDDRVREAVVAALEGLGPPPVEDVPKLAALLSEDNSDAAYWAATLLGRCGQEAAGATQELLAVVNSAADLAARERAVWALGRIGPTATAALPVLQKVAAAEGSPRLARRARGAIEKIRGG